MQRKLFHLIGQPEKSVQIFNSELIERKNIFVRKVSMYLAFIRKKQRSIQL